MAMQFVEFFFSKSTRKKITRKKNKLQNYNNS